MKTIEIANATAPLADFARRASKGAVVVTRRGKPMAAVIPMEQTDYESLSLSTNPRFLEILARSRARLEKEGGISIAEMYRRLGLDQPRRRQTKNKKRRGR